MIFFAKDKKRFINWKVTGFTLIILGGFFGAFTSLGPNIEAYGGTKPSNSFHPALISGRALSDGNITYRLVGIDTCKVGQTIRYAEAKLERDCGTIAMKWLAKFVGDYGIVCYDQKQPNVRGQMIARCFVDDNKRGHTLEADISYFMLRSGWATFDPLGSNALYSLRYSGMEAKAKLERRGAWGGIISKVNQ